MPDNKGQKKEVWVALILLISIVVLGISTTWFLFKLFPSEIALQIKRSGMTATVFGGSALFLLVTWLYSSMYTKLLRVIAPLVVVGILTFYFESPNMNDFPASTTIIIDRNSEVIFNQTGAGALRTEMEAREMAEAKAKVKESVRVEAGGGGNSLSELQSFTDIRLGILKLNTRPSGADILINGNLKGASPISIELPAGRHELVVSKKGYHSLETIIDLPEGETVPLNLTLIEKEIP